MNLLDMTLPQAFEAICGCGFWAVTGILTAAVILPSFMVCLVPVMYLYWKSFQYYRGAARDTNRIQSVNNSPMLAHFSETLGGLATIRAFERQRHFMSDNRLLIDHAMQPYFASQTVRRWMDVRLGCVNATLAWCCAFILVALRDVFGTPVDIILAGLALKNILGNVQALSMLVMFSSQVEANLNAVERVSHYAGDAVPIEAAWHTPNPPPESWPSNGVVSLSKYSVGYKKDDGPVLQALSFAIGAQEKIGVVGRTGAGKSSKSRHNLEFLWAVQSRSSPTRCLSSASWRAIPAA